MLDLAALAGTETVLDLYCGIGTISLYLARRAAHVIGVEIVPQATEDARRNAELNDIHNAEFFTGRAEKVVPELVRQKNIRADVVVVDPPRKVFRYRLKNLSMSAVIRPRCPGTSNI